ncbi:beta-propeller domain-containing protein [Desulfosporosinus hippei]|uniref:Secreted protein containing C-terminal beta-propeller domain n=1 Tax=Desulfosporosinus hippei DSM 8344 TaxID=1121419 RepID=A0A1G7VUH0_9FIRM|nr:beta-propeller domain-containing protein [Desulfosporosinus hippei]SDG63049.1 Secreted protein containing C-terminal beta-propeller domain [Desulfosporosinus hippei DSM 8344]
MKRKLWYSLAVLAVFTGMIIMTGLNEPPKQSIAQEPEQAQPENLGLPTLGSLDNLRSILKDAENSRGLMGQGVLMGAIALDGMTKSAGAPPVDQASPTNSGVTSKESKNYSTTNLQVAEVDEADIVKSDGTYLYQVNNQELLVIQADPSDQMHIVKRISFDENEFSPQELYVDNQYLVVLGNAIYPETLPSAAEKDQSKAMIYPPIFHKSTTKVIIYNLADKANITKLREVELDGDYVSSRKIGSNLYLMANQYLDLYRIMNSDMEPTLPSYRDTALNNEFVSLDYAKIRYFPDCIEPNYLMIASLNLDQAQQEMQVQTFLGSGQNVYASPSDLYIAVTQYERAEQDPSGTTPKKHVISGPYSMATALYRFSLDPDGIELQAKGTVPGNILNQFSMDEYNDCFRIATTTGEIWRSDETTSKNNVYILGQDLQLMGKIEDIAPGERIYSVRFMGDRGYMVTFKNVDPFFVLDLKDPSAPQILGALKIPGYSDYLHPYDENHIIGFGKETIELSSTNNPGILPGSPMGSNAYYQGMKLAVFDVTDVSKPVEMYKTTIGDRGTDSEVLHNHKALLFDQEKGLLSFPVTVMEVKNSVKSPSGVPQYGSFTFQGAYVYNFDLHSGFTLRGKITHLDKPDLLKAGQHYYGIKEIERVLYIGNTLYTVSKGKIKANDLNSLEEKKSLSLNP